MTANEARPPSSQQPAQRGHRPQPDARVAVTCAFGRIRRFGHDVNLN
ncbi:MULTISPECIES: hypothetical protein [unclassified Streptomyces]